MASTNGSSVTSGRGSSLRADERVGRVTSISGGSFYALLRQARIVGFDVAYDTGIR
jgi:hypothetical protein